MEVCPKSPGDEDNVDESRMLELTIDVRDDNVRVRSVSALDDRCDDPQPSGRITLASLLRHTTQSGRFISKQISQELELIRNWAASTPRSRSRSRPSSPDRDRLVKILALSRSNSAVSSRSSASQQQPRIRKQQSGDLFLARSRSGAETALQGLRYISRAIESADQKAVWEAVEMRFQQLAKPDGMLDRGDFGLCIGMPDSREFTGELFDALARRKHQNLQCINKEELYEFWLQLSDQSFDSRIQIFFDMCDKDADGRITEEEVKEIIILSASANKLSKLNEQAEEYAALIMEELDPSGIGYIELWQLESLMLGQFASLAQDGYLNYSQTWSQTLAFEQSGKIILCARKIKYFVIENWQRVWVVGLWIFAMCGLFLWKFFAYKQTSAFKLLGYCLCSAKGAAETLKLNMALVLLPVCRNTITWLRSTIVGSVVPFDDSLNFHKIIAGAIVAGVGIHATVHLACDFPRIIRASEEEFMIYLGRGFHYKQPTYVGILVSIEGVTGISMVIMMSIAFVLATRWFRRNLVRLPWPLHRLTGFNAFWYSHHLFMVVYVLLLLHSIFLFFTNDWVAKSTWMYLSVPVLLYSVERILSAFRARHFTVQVVKAAIHPGNVLALKMTKPPTFKYKSGMYLFIKCISISPFEWHPFSITSAPSDRHLSVHIRTVGDWTEELRRIFSKALGGLAEKENVLESESSDISIIRHRFPKLQIDGPYGAPAQDYQKYDVLLLVGIGIGATPFISVLKDMLNQIKLADQQQFLSMKQIRSPRKRNERKLQCPTNAYFYWVTREQGSFEWFRGVLNEVAEIDNKAVIEMHNYLTSVYEEGDARSALITMMQAFHHAKNGVDIVSGTRVRTHFARPKWYKVFSRLANIHTNSRIGVFYCGPMVLARELDALSSEFNQISNSKFEFHKENF
ncbi:respiratory burst oxidase homolog protein F isoform X1 [Selaginella moellendorffii]|uniref:respiratory burst oxidase homolog protein F isoform X1 n=1 Tax=Selaginella moellendorffii TaxID=88036 RepID=UPI000D1CB1D6|nr:respiratory burst oxidase homolog protein F isoform X1 [Selaginella moellendorffii]|eukprot:XP_024531669.1 respiratory burst oxidase homolog protein F isoform X1 [Selaginella moellendorffii]